MTIKQWKTIEPIILEAFKVPARSRIVFLEDQLGKDKELLAYAHRILRLVDRPGENDQIDDVISGWRILLPIGSDGLGMDYLAERADGSMEALVNLKVARVLLEDAALQQQFVQEMRILTMLYDANIGRVLDMGWVSESRPFVVSEFEGGLPITEVALKMDLRENLTAFLRLLTAMGYAHQRKILHGDLKPSNVLLSMERVPRLMDFGLARVFAKGGDAIATQTQIAAESLAYYSPEQIRGKELTEASDVYSLGVILYEMLSGKPPYGSPKDTIMERGRAICEAIPPKIEGVDEDVNYIVAKAIEKNLEGRYPTTIIFGRDIEAYLEGRGVMPRREAMTEFILRSLKQNWVTAALVVAVLAVGVFAVFQRSKSNDKAAQIQNITNSLFAGGGGKGGGKGGENMSTTQSAKKYLDNMLAKNAGKPEVVGELAKAYLRLAEVELKGSGLLAGDRGAAIQSARKAYELTMQLASSEGTTDIELLEYARSAKMLSELLNEAQDYKEAMKVAQDWKNKLSAFSSANPQVKKALAAADATLSDLMFLAGDQQASMPFARSAMRQFGSIFEADKGNVDKARDYAQSANNVGGKALRMGMFSEALSMFKTAETTLRPAAEKPDSEVGPLLDLAKTLSGLGETLEKSKQGDQARASYKEARQLLEQANKKEKDNEDAAEGLADILVKTSRMNREGGDLGVATADNDRAVELLRKLVGRPGSRSDLRKRLAIALTLKGELARVEKKGPIAQEAFEEAIGMWNSYGRMAGLRPEEEIEIDRLKTIAGR
ncbi:MAG: serine/threonine protein kinase [Acidobacteria bacterium]|nr:serine/threonine protein kinase [Acidobacteriota bacterium]